MLINRKIELLGLILVPLTVYLTYGSLQRAALAACVYVALDILFNLLRDL